jgi:type IV pilus assembly protein PilM
MAKKISHVWGIEVGQSAVKALRCHLDGDQVVADAFDYVEYPKILSQPDANAEELVAEALQQFLSRNDLKHCRVGISVPGQSGLSKFFKPPPVEVKKIPDIVKYEAKQQIPFDLNDVIWDFQQMAGSNIEDGYALESEVGLFAMKKEAVHRALKPFRDAGIGVDLLQLAPMSVYNMLTYEKFSERLASETFDPDEPPKSTVLLSMGTDSSDLIVTNGFRVWQRSMPIGGNHFTRQLTKDLKLTFAKAEHLKRNAMQAEDPKMVFQSMRPVFNDLVTEIQRSISFFKSMNKKSEVDELWLLGNTARLPGLQPYLNKNLAMETTNLDQFVRLGGDEVKNAPAFKEHQLAYGVVYGLCLQLLDKGSMSTNLVPREIVVERIIKAKKPWAVAALSAMLLGFLANYAFMQRSWSNVSANKWSSAEQSAKSTSGASKQELDEDAKRKATIELLTKVGQEVSSNADRRILLPELLVAIQGGLNRQAADPNQPPPTPETLPYSERADFHIERIDSQYQPDLAKWYGKEVQSLYALQKKAREDLLKITPPKDAAAQAAQDALKGAGWVVELEGYHYYNGKPGKEQEAHVFANIMNYLENGNLQLPDDAGKMYTFTMKEMGISHPIMVSKSYDPNYRVPNPAYLIATGGTAGGSAGGLLGGGSSRPNIGSSGGPGIGSAGSGSAGLDSEGGAAGGDTGAAGGAGGLGGGLGGGSAPGMTEPVDENGKPIPKDFKAPKFTFTLQFVWQEAPRSKRVELQIEEQKKANKNQAGQQANGVAANP